MQPAGFNKDLWNWLYIDDFGQISIMVQQGDNARFVKTPIDNVIEVRAHVRRVTRNFRCESAASGGGGGEKSRLFVPQKARTFSSHANCEAYSVLELQSRLSER